MACMAVPSARKGAGVSAGLETRESSCRRSCPRQGVMSSGTNEVEKGVRWMPRLLQAKKDVISCEKPRVGANDL